MPLPSPAGAGTKIPATNRKREETRGKEMTKTFCGDLVNEAGDHLGMIHRMGAGYVIRKPVEFSRDLGPVIFDGRVFSAKDFAHVRTTNLGYRTVKSYQMVGA